MLRFHNVNANSDSNVKMSPLNIHVNHAFDNLVFSI